MQPGDTPTSHDVATTNNLSSAQLKVTADQFLGAQLEPSRNDALAAVQQGVSQGLSVPSLYVDVIAWAQYEIGRLWQENKISVAQEHVATAIAGLALSQLYGNLPRSPQHGHRAVVGSVEGELHQLGATMVADFLEMEGFEVHLLGANTPTESMVALVQETSADVVALSATMPFHIPALLAAVSAIRDAVGDTVHIIVGGQAVAHLSDTSQLGAVAIEVDALHAATDLRLAVTSDRV